VDLVVKFQKLNLQLAKNMKISRIRSLTLFFIVFLTGCFSFSDHVSFFIVSTGDTSNISIYKSKIGFYTNIHSGNSDEYGFVVPKNLDHISAHQIISATYKYKNILLDFSDKSEIIINSKPESCTLTLKLFDSKGRPSILNGTYVATEYVGSKYKTCDR
jgi:hypothetical protein